MEVFKEVFLKSINLKILAFLGQLLSNFLRNFEHVFLKIWSILGDSPMIDTLGDDPAVTC